MIKIEFKGGAELSKKMRQVATDLKGQAFVSAMDKSLMLVLRTAREDAPVDTGRLKNSIVSDIRVTDKVVNGVVGTDVIYAPYIEFGTGSFAGKPAHFPPPSALMTWARRHGVNAYAVARAIYLRGGLKPKPFLMPAFEKHKAQIQQLLGDAIAKIVSK